jgi:S-DNA-T family DNA segregation ATPase FtsK/SpoIIIE
VTAPPGDGRVLAVVAARPRALLGPLRATGARVVELGGASPVPGDLHVAEAPVPTVLLGDPDAWIADWAMLAAARRDWPIALVGVTAADHRALLRDGVPPPPLGARPGECWLAHGGRTQRAVLVMPEHGA